MPTWQKVPYHFTKAEKWPTFRKLIIIISIIHEYLTKPVSTIIDVIIF